ncbi:MAG TPA: hypothetical protein DEP87_03495 [Candidatus Pacebacteria bacterium]|nr:hypothetical protein [Candidatus Paceibacterota bacterium]
MNIVWHQTSFPSSAAVTSKLSELPKLPIAVAILTPANPTPEITQALEQALMSASFAESFWLGQATTKITDFAAARNSLLAQVSEPWVMWLDGDEWLAQPDQAAQILGFALNHASSDEKLLGFTLNRRDWFHRQPLRYGEPAQVNLVRLHRTQAGEFYQAVHEVFQPKLPGFFMPLSLQLEHRSHQSLNHFFAKICDYAQLRARELSQAKTQRAKWQIILELLIWPPAKFGWNYFWLQGWRDGWRGFSYALMMSLHSALVRIFLWEELKLRH